MELNTLISKNSKANSFEYAEKIERIIKKIKVNDAEKKRYN